MSFESIKLEKGMYNVRGGITAALESIDPSENYKGTALEGLDAYQRQLKRFDIKVSGAGSDVVEKFFSTTDSAALFPEYITRAVRTGITEENILPEMIATTTRINGMDYRSIISNPTDDEKSLKAVAEGAVIPETVIRTDEKLVNLKKRGRMLVASYEALKYQRLDLFTVTLKQIGAYIAKQQLFDAVSVLMKDAEIVNIPEPEISYSAFINLWNELAPYNLNCIVASPDILTAILNLPQFQNAENGFTFMNSGKLDKPLGAKIIRYDDGTPNLLYGFDKNYALEMVIANDVTVDYDRLIDRQLERAAITSTVGFSKIFNDAVRQVQL